MGGEAALCLDVSLGSRNEPHVCLTVLGQWWWPHRLCSWPMDWPIFRAAGDVGLSGVCRLGSVLLCLGMTNYRWEIGPVPDDAIAPDRWRAPLKVSGIQVPDFYRN